MDRVNSRIAQVYGYAVCFITVVVMLFSIKGVVDALIDLSDPIRAEAGGFGRMGHPLTNFDVYKMAVRRACARGTGRAPARSADSNNGAGRHTLRCRSAPDVRRRA
jgi:hypothetical protein